MSLVEGLLAGVGTGLAGRLVASDDTFEGVAYS